MFWKEIKGIWDRGTRDDMNYNFGLFARDIAKSLLTSMTAENKSKNAENLAQNALNTVTTKGNEAIATAKRAETIADATQKQLQNVVAEAGNSNAEIVAGRKDTETGEEFVTIGARMDQQHKAVTRQLAQNTAQSINLANATVPLQIPSYVGAPQATHPSPIDMGTQWNGYRHWFAFTPYYKSDEGIEDPCVAASNDGINFVVPDGLKNPLASTPNKNNMHHSDTHIVFNYVLQRMEVWYRRLHRGAEAKREYICRRTTTNGRDWTAEEKLSPEHTGGGVIYLSPVVIFDDNKYRIWCYNDTTSKLDYYESVNGDNWQLIRNIERPPHKDNLYIWHMDIKKTARGYEMYYCAAPTKSTICPYICYAVSDDNVTFGEAVTVMEQKSDGLDGYSLYRPAFMDVGNTRYLYYGCLSKDADWHIALSFATVDNPTALRGLTQAELSGGDYSTEQDVALSEMSLKIGQLKTEVENVIITAKDSLKNSVELQSNGKNTVIYDAAGQPSVMVAIPRFNLSEVIQGAPNTPHPAFIVNGVVKDVIYVSKYLNATTNNVAVSMPALAPRTNVNFDLARTLCKNKGTGWHLMTNAEWAAIALWSLKNGTLPRGNNNYGADIDNPLERGVTATKGADGRTNATKSGTGASGWSHDHTTDGVYDLNGNVWEWVDGLKIVNGRIVVMPNNDYTKTESDWVQTDEYCDSYSGSLVINNTKSTNTTALLSRNFSDLQAMPGHTVSDLLKNLALFPHNDDVIDDGLLVALPTGEQIARRGGNWEYGKQAGAYALSLHNVRTSNNAATGFRAVYIP